MKQLDVVAPGLNYLTCPSFADLLVGTASFTYEKRPWATAKNDPIVVLHSSGSTGIPKPVTMTHGTFSILDNERNLPGVAGRKKRDFSIWDFPGGGRFYHIFPYFHLAGFLSNIGKFPVHGICKRSFVANPVFTESSSPVLGPPLQPPSGDLLKAIMKSQPLKALYIPPAIAEQLLQEPDRLDLFKQLDFLCYTGAPFSPTAGEKLVTVTELVSLYGSTEAFQVPQLVPAKEDWAYMEWNPNFKLEMQPSDDEYGVYELVLFTDETTETISALNHNLPGTEVWRTKDLFKPHPTKKDLWRYYGRRDDIIVLSNGEKFNPVPFELAVQGHPSLAGALVVGLGRVRPVLLLERKDDMVSVEDVWSKVEEANTLVPGHGRILAREDVLVVDRPFTRAGKGTVVRKLTEKAFEGEIDALYKRDRVDVQSVEVPTTYEGVVNFIREALVSFFPVAENMSDDDDVYSYGLDSIGTVQLVKVLKTIGASITPLTVYNHPTINLLATAMTNTTIPNDRLSLMNDLIAKYSHSTPTPTPSTSTSAPTIAITGTTGSLGTSILASLILSPAVTTIICLNRDPNAQKRQHASLSALGVTNTTKLHFLTTSLEKPTLGPFKPDIIIHNAWRLDFNLSLHSYIHPYIHSVRSLLDLCPPGTRLVFISSVSSSMNSVLVPEEITPPSHSMALGYGESKSVAEHILSASGIPTTILRVGQVGGPTDPTLPPWPTHEWLYPVIKASKALGVIPTCHFPITWVPIDLAAKGIVELTLSATGSEVYNVVNPKVVEWKMLAEEMKKRFGEEYRIVSLEEWLATVRERGGEDTMLDAAAKMMEEMVKVPGDLKFVTERAVRGSETLRGMKAIDADLVRMWLDQWGF